MFKRIYAALKTPEYILKEIAHRTPNPWFKHDFELSESYQRNFRDLQSSGITILNEFLNSQQLESARESFSKLVQGRHGKNPDSQYNDQPFKQEASLLSIALDDIILGFASAYFRKSFGISRADGLRLLPTSCPPYGSFQWHHDARGKQLHVMVLLTDLDKNGQAMRYLMGSHRRIYSYRQGRQETVFNDYVSRLNSKDICLVTGKAGTVAIFDSNGLHAGYRSNSYIRDTLTFCYATWRHFKPLEVPERYFGGFDASKRQILSNNPRIKYVNS